MFLFFEIAIADIGESNLLVNMFEPLFRWHTPIVLSPDPDTNYVPPGVIATELTRSVWPSRVFR